MKSRVLAGLSLTLAMFLLLATCVGCGASGVKTMPASYMSAMRQTGKSTIGRYWENWFEREKRRSVNPTYVDSLNEKCIAAIERVLSSAKDFPYAERSALGLVGSGPAESVATEYYTGLKNNNAITAILELEFFYGVKSGLGKKRVYMTVKWKIRSPDGKTRIELDEDQTEAIADTADEMLPTTTDPRYEATFVELAGRNAKQFLTLIAR
jgi:hypothetical protein